MHELSIAMRILDLAQEESDLRGGVTIDAIHLKLGALSGVAKQALLFSYDLASAQTALAGTRLVIEEVPIVVNCPTCKGPRPVQSMQSFRCAECGTPTEEVLEGRELMVTALEIRE